MATQHYELSGLNSKTVISTKYAMSIQVLLPLRLAMFKTRFACDIMLNRSTTRQWMANLFPPQLAQIILNSIKDPINSSLYT